MLTGGLHPSRTMTMSHTFFSGAQVLQSFRSGHAIQTLAGYMHSPYSVLLAASSFAIFGAKDWVPYAGSAIVVVCYLAGLCYFLRHLRSACKWARSSSFSVSPLPQWRSSNSVPTSLPETLVGFATVYLSTANKDFSSRIEAVGLRLIYGAAMMTKPSTFLMTTSVIGLGGLLRTLRGAFGRKLTASRIFVWLICFLLSTLLVAGPYYFIHFEQIWSYFYGNSFGKNKDIWVPAQTLSAHLSHYIDSAECRRFKSWKMETARLCLRGIVFAVWHAAD